jgi:hypothetical protein
LLFEHGQQQRHLLQIMLPMFFFLLLLMDLIR